MSSEKNYSPDEVAKQILQKYHSLAKGLFADNSPKMALQCSAPEQDKESVFREIKWCLDDIKSLKELRWTVEEEAPSAKEMFEKEFESKKAKLASLIRKHKNLKKSEDSEVEEVIVEKFMAIADEIWKAEKVVENKEGVVTPAEDKKDKKEVDKCGDMKIMKADDSKLKAFMEKRKAKKAGKMEKMLGMNQAQTPATGQQPSIATQIGWPGTKK